VNHLIPLEECAEDDTYDLRSETAFDALAYVHESRGLNHRYRHATLFRWCGTNPMACEPTEADKLEDE